MQLFLRENVPLRRWYVLAESHTIEIQLQTLKHQLLSTEGMNPSVKDGAMPLHLTQIENYFLKSDAVTIIFLERM